MTATFNGTAPLNGDDLLAVIKPQLRVVAVQVCLKPDLIEKWEELDHNLAAAQDAPATGGRLAGGGAKVDIRKLARELQKLEGEIDEVSPWFRFRALSNEVFQSLCLKNPPRKENQFDFLRGYNVDVVSDGLVRICLIDPVFSDEGWAQLMAVCAPSQWTAMRNAAVEANGGQVAPPKSQQASRVLSKRGNDSE